MTPVALVVEDDADLNELYQDAMLKAGYDVESARNAVQALHVLGRRKADVIVLDLRMVGGRGDHVLSYVKGNRRFADTKVIVVTGDASQEALVREMGADHFLVKPVDVNELAELARSLQK